MNLSRRKLFLPSTAADQIIQAPERRAMHPLARHMADWAAIRKSRAAAASAHILADQQTQHFIKQQQARHVSFIRRLSRRVFMATAAATVVTTAAYADTAFTSFSFKATGGTTNRTMPARIADIFNILDYGADPTGAADSQPAYAAAITAASNSGLIFTPKGNFKILSAVPITVASSLQFVGEGAGSFVFGNFNGFIFDNLSDPYNASGNPSSIENMNIANAFVGNTFSMATGGTWTASGSPVNILLSGSNPGVAAGGALWVTGFGTNSVFIGMITSVASWPTVTVSSAAISSGAGALTAQIIQCYAASGSFSAAATTITMAATRPSGIGTGLYYVYDYDYYLADARYGEPLGVASWNGTTVTFTGSSNGSVFPSIGTSDRLWFAPVAGCIRYSSVVGAKVINTFLSGFWGVQSSECKILASDSTGGSAQGFHIEVDTCTFSNPSGFSGLMGQTGIYLTNNSVSINTNASGLWCVERLSGTANGIIGGRCEVNHFGIIIGGDFTPSNGSLSNGYIIGRSMESNLQAIYCKGGSCSIISSGASCNVSAGALGGLYLNGFSGVVEKSDFTGHFGTGYPIYIADPGNNRGQIKFAACTGQHIDTPAQGWRIPAQAWWGTCEVSDNPPLVYAFGGLPTGSSSPTPFAGENYDISDCNTSTFLATAAAGGTGAAAQRHVRWNNTSSLWQVVG